MRLGLPGNFVDTNIPSALYLRLIICFMRLPCIFPLRYGLKATTHILAVLGLVLCFAATSLLLSPSQSCAQAMPSRLGGDKIWDWSDFRGNLGFRVYMPRLIAGSVHVSSVSGETSYQPEDYDMLGHANLSHLPQPDFFKEGWFVLYIDRLALRANFEEDHSFRGAAPYENDPTQAAISELQVGWTRFGLDLDVIRYPFIRAGINFDRNFESVIYLDRHRLRTVERDGRQTTLHALKLTTHQPPVTLGVHAFASPGRVFGIPVTGQARARVPFPYLTKITGEPAETRITEWEVCIGLRPNIWNTSLYGYSTFSLGIDAGFKSTYLDMDSGDGVWNVKAHWQGPYVQVGLYF
jgi:hypothetical protein